MLHTIRFYHDERDFALLDNWGRGRLLLGLHVWALLCSHLVGLHFALSHCRCCRFTGCRIGPGKLRVSSRGRARAVPRERSVASWQDRTIFVCILEHLECHCGGPVSFFSLSGFFSFGDYIIRELIHIELFISILVHVGKELVPLKVRTKNTIFLRRVFLEILSYFGLRQESIFILVCILKHLVCNSFRLGNASSGLA